MLFVLVLYMSTKQHFILIVYVVEMRFKQIVKGSNQKGGAVERFLFIATASVAVASQHLS